MQMHACKHGDKGHLQLLVLLHEFQQLNVPVLQAGEPPHALQHNERCQHPDCPVSAQLAARDKLGAQS